MSTLSQYVGPVISNNAEEVSVSLQDPSNSRVAKNTIMPKDYDRQRLDNNKANSEKTFRFSRGGLMGGCVLKVVVDAFDASATENVSFERGWGYNLVRKFSYKMGNSREYFVDGISNLLHVMDNAPTETQKLRILELGGKPVANVPANSLGGFTLYVVLTLPMSGPAGHCCNDKLPYNSELLEDDVELKILFNDWTQVANGYKDLFAANKKFPSFSAEVIMEKYAFAMPTANIAPSIKAGGRNDYMFMFPNYLSQQKIKPVDDGQGSYTLTANVSGWRQGGTTSLLLALEAEKDYSTYNSSDDPTQSSQHHYYTAIENLEVILDGSQIVQMKDDESRINSLLRGPEDHFLITTVDNGNYSPYTTVKLSQHAKKDILGENFWESGTELVSKTLQFNMKTPKPKEESGTPPEYYTLHIVQNISASVMSAGRQNEIVFVRR